MNKNEIINKLLSISINEDESMKIINETIKYIDKINDKYELKKPIFVPSDVEFDCPHCKERIPYGDNWLHCPNCGGALDWESVEIGEDEDE